MSEVYQCSSLKADKKPCTKPGVEIYDGQYYCKVHFKSVSKETKPKAKTPTKNQDTEVKKNMSDTEYERESINVDDINSDSDLEEKAPPLKKETKENKNSKDSNSCSGQKKDGDSCEKNGTELYNEKYYCKVHLKQILKNENKKICEGIKKDGNRCDKNGTEEYNERYYCKIHLKQIITKESIKSCEGIKKDGSNCEKQGTELHNEKYYCKTHLKSTIAEESIKYCDSFKKNGDKCEKKATNCHNDKNYCTVHFKQISTPNAKETKPKDNVSFEKAEAKKIIKEIQDFVKISSTKYHTEEDYTSIKRQFKDLALKIHPDKCKNTNLDATELFKKLSAHMDKIKKYESNDN